MAAKEKTGPYRRTTRTKARRMPMIEANPACLRSLIVTDVDTSDVRDLATMCGLPAPTWTVMHPGPVVTGHIAYGLANPVCVTDAASRRPVNLLARIETGLCDILGGDIGYAGKIMKTPSHPLMGNTPSGGLGEGEECRSYQLKQLAAPLDKLGALPAPSSGAPRYYRDEYPSLAKGMGCSPASVNRYIKETGSLRRKL
ncbi:replication initiation protein [Corynebacterium uropygiale]|uniref:replication initiation protein n=1 Tax=Corynebacterium uropygiale TaxID=1775911 RepID=UPI003B836D2B